MNASELLREFESSPIPKQEIPGIIGILESIKARLFLQLWQPNQSPTVEPEDGDTLLTIEEMAKRTSFTEQYWYGLIRTGELASVRTGKYVRVRVADLSRWIESHTERKQFDNNIYKLYSNSMDGKELLKIRTAIGRTQAQLAELIGVSSNTVARWERDEVKISEPLSRFIHLLAKMELEANRKDKTGRH